MLYMFMFNPIAHYYKLPQDKNPPCFALYYVLNAWPIKWAFDKNTF